MNKNISVGLTTIAAAALALPIWAQSTAPNSDERNTRLARPIEEVIVTAQKREEKLQDVPISISVLGGELLDKSTVRDATEALSRVPGVATTPIFLGGGSQVIIRGASTNQAINSGSSTTAYYLDSVPFGFAKSSIGPDPDVYDLKQIEVLRGPQGTLYGSSALNGVVRILTNEANPNDFEFKGRALSSSTESGGENYRADAAVNVPLVEGKLAVRAVAGYQNLSGWIDRLTEKDANTAEVRNARLRIDGRPSDRMSVGAFAWLSRADYGAPSTGVSAEQSTAVIDEPTETDYDAYGLKLGYEFPWASVRSMTSYLEYMNDTVYDSLPNRAGGFLFLTTLDSETFAEEITISSAHGGPWRWSVGGIYRDAEDKRFVRVTNPILLPDNLTNSSESFAVYGELTRAFFGGALELTGGLRYFDDEVGLLEHSRLGTVGQQPAPYVNRTRNFTATTPRVVLTWHPSTRMTTYASYSEGFRSGVHQVPSVAALGLTEAKPDKLKNYEVGVKGSALDGGVSFDAAVYYVDWQDVQRSLQVPITLPGNTTPTPFTGVINSENASGIGVDFGVIVEPVERLELSANISWNDLTSDADVPSLGLVFIPEGERLDQSPEYTIGGSIDYAFPIGGAGYEGRFSTGANYLSEVIQRGIDGPRVTGGVSVPRNVVTGTSDATLIARASFSIAAPKNWVATLFVDNLTNEDQTPLRVAQPTFQPLLFGPDLFNKDNVQVRPRTVGLQFEYRY